MHAEVSLQQVVFYDGDEEQITALIWQHYLDHGHLLVPLKTDVAAGTSFAPACRRLSSPINTSTRKTSFDSAALRDQVKQMVLANDGPDAVIASNAPFVLDSAIRFCLATERPLIGGDELIDGLKNSVRAGMKSVIAFGQLNDFSPKFLGELWRLAREQRLQIGLVPGRSSKEIEWWLTKRLFANVFYEDYLGGIILARDIRAASYTDSDFVVAESDFNSEDSSRLSRPHQFCLAQFHAKECCAKFNNHVVCGLKPGGLPLKKTHESVPGCAESLGCIWPLTRIPFYEINAAHFIAISCGSLRLQNRLFHPEVGLGLNIFSATPRSYLSPTRFVTSTEILPSLLSDLIMAGVSLGEIANTANDVIRRGSCDNECFVLLGDPVDKIDVGKALGFGAVEVQEKAVVETESMPGCMEVSQFDVPVVTDGLEKSFVVSATDPMSSQSIIEKLPTEILHFVSPEGGPLSSPVLLSALLKSDHNEGMWLSLKYGASVHVLTEEQLACLWCAAECAVYSRKHEALWDRMIVNCPRCGIIADLPRGSYEKVTLETPERLSRGEQFELRSVCLTAQQESGVACGFSLIHCRNFGWSTFADTTPALKFIDGGAVASMNLTVPEIAYPFAYWVRATWIVAEGICWISRPLIVFAN